jgi:hypothetical protein
VLFGTCPLLRTGLLISFDGNQKYVTTCFVGVSNSPLPVSRPALASIGHPTDNAELVTPTKHGHDTQSAEISRVAVRLPPFWPERSAVWFSQADAQFSLAGISNERTGPPVRRRGGRHYLLPTPARLLHETSDQAPEPAVPLQGAAYSPLPHARDLVPPTKHGYGHLSIVAHLGGSHTVMSPAELEPERHFVSEIQQQL